MTLQILFAYLHYAAFAALAASLLVEFLLLEPAMPLPSVKRIQRIDLVYGISAVVMLLSGIGRVVTEKGAAYYLHNHLFWTKMALFAAIGLMSALPTIRFIRWKPETTGLVLAAGEYRSLRRLLHWQLALLLLIPLCAVLMARGIGFVG